MTLRGDSFFTGVALLETAFRAATQASGYVEVTGRPPHEDGLHQHWPKPAQWDVWSEQSVVNDPWGSPEIRAFKAVGKI